MIGREVPLGSAVLLLDRAAEGSTTTESFFSGGSALQSQPELVLDQATGEAQVLCEGAVLASVPAGSSAHLAALCTLQSEGLVALKAAWPEEGRQHARDRLRVEVALKPAALRQTEPAEASGAARRQAKAQAAVMAQVAGLLLQEESGGFRGGGAGVAKGRGGGLVGALRLAPREPPPRVLCSADHMGDQEEGQQGQLPPSGLRDAVFAAAAPSDWQEQADAPGLNCELHEYQKRALAWALWREGAGTAATAEHAPCHPLWLPVALPLPGASKAAAAAAASLHYSPSLGRFSREAPPPLAPPERLSGGILADEMGLGKTVEVIALLTANPPPWASRRAPRDVGAAGAPPALEQVWMELEGSLRGLGAGTLIVTPQPLMKQWAQELNTHARDLKVMEYHGLAHIAKMLKRTIAKKPGKAVKGADSVGKDLGLGFCEEETEAATADDFRELSRLMAKRMQANDVVLTTFAVLKDEVHYVSHGDSDRSFRHEKKFQVPDSPLLKVDWWRTVMDEAQMAGSGVSAVAKMATRLSSKHRWAVSGTPIGPRAEGDLLDMLSMLQQRTAMWADAMRPYLSDQPLGWTLLRSALSQIMWRNSKALVASELQLPPRTLHTVRLSLTPVERTFYDKILENTRKAAKRLRTNDEQATKTSAKGQREATQDPLTPVHLGKRKWGENAPGLSPHAPKLTKKAKALEASAWNEIKQLRLACIHPEITTYWKEIGKKNNMESLTTGALSLKEIQERMIHEVQVELQARERELCAVLNKLAEELLEECSADPAHQDSNSGSNFMPATSAKKKKVVPANENATSPGQSNGAAARLFSGNATPEEFRQQAIQALEMSYNIGEHGISAAYSTTDVTVRIENDIATDDAALKAWRHIEVRTAQLLAELYCPDTQAAKREVMEQELKKKKADLVESDSKMLEQKAVKVASLKSELEQNEKALFDLTQKALDAGAQRSPMACLRSTEKWLSGVKESVAAAKVQEQRWRKRNAAENGTQGLLGTAVIDATRPMEQELMEPSRNLATVLAEQHLRGRAAHVKDAVDALRAKWATCEAPGMQICLLSPRAQVHPPHELLLWAALEGRGNTGSVRRLATCLRAAAKDSHLNEAISVMEMVFRSLDREHRKLWEKMASMDKDSAAMLTSMSTEAAERAQDAIACKLKILRLYRELHKAETELELAQHNLQQTLEKAETSAASAASLPPQARDKSAKQLYELLFGGGGSHKREPMLQAVQGVYARKNFLQNQLEELLKSSSNNQAVDMTGIAQGSATSGPLPLLKGQHFPGNWRESWAAPGGLASALGDGPLLPSSQKNGNTHAGGLRLGPSGFREAASSRGGAKADEAAASAGPGPGPAESGAAKEEEAQPSAKADASTGAAPEAEADGGGSGTLGACPTCFEPLAGKRVHFFPCGHRYCGACHMQHLLAYGAAGGGSGQRRIPCFYCRRVTAISEVAQAVITTGEEREPSSAQQDEHKYAKVDVKDQWQTKLDALLRRLLHLRNTAPQEKSLVFSAFPEALTKLGQALKANHIEFVKLEAGQKGKHNRAVEDFRSNEECRVFLLSLSAGGAGLTLVSANHVFLLEPALSPGIAQQAVARVHRIGQQRPVHITRFVVRETVEEEVQRIQEAQQDLLLSEDTQALSQVVRNEAHDPAVMRDLLKTVCT